MECRRVYIGKRNTIACGITLKLSTISIQKYEKHLWMKALKQCQLAGLTVGEIDSDKYDYIPRNITSFPQEGKSRRASHARNIAQFVNWA